MEIPSSVETLSKNTITSCSNLINLSIDSRDIPYKAFENVPKIRVIRFGDNVESLRSNCFINANGVKELKFGKKVSIIEQGVFSTSVKLESITVSNESKTLLLENGVLYVLNNSEPISIALILETAIAVKIGPKIKDVSIKGINIPTLRNITVDPNNDYYSSESNALYNKDFSVLYLIAALSDNLNVNPNTRNISTAAAKVCRIRHISLNEGLEYILNEAFQGSLLTEIVIPLSVVYIGGSSFSTCGSLSSVTINSKNITMQDWIFSYCKVSIFEFADDTYIEDLPAQMFMKCTNLLSIKIPRSLKRIHGQCFRDSGINEITFPDDSCLEYINHDAFRNTNLKKINLPRKLLCIYENCFEESKLESVTVKVGSLLKEIRDSAFYGNPITTLDLSGALNLELISDKAFSGSKIISLNLPSGVRIIGENAFANFRGLETVIFASYNNLTNLSSYAFAECSSLTSVNLGINSSIKSLQPAVFYKCFNLLTFKIPDSVEFIRAQTFFQCNSLYDIQIGIDSKLCEIGERAFEGCTSMAKIFIPKLVQSIHIRAFYRDSSLNEVKFDPNSNCRSISTNAFYGCSSIKEINFPSKIEEIGSRAFETCISLENITFDKNCKLDTIKTETFLDCNKIKELNFPKLVRIVENGAFNGCLNLKRISFDDGSILQEIADSSFFGCEQLIEINFGNGKKLEKNRRASIF